MGPTEHGQLTDAEERLAEAYVSLLDFVSRCAQAIDSGNWHYLYNKAYQLENAAERFTRIAEYTWRETDAGQPRPRTEAVRAAVALSGRHYHAVRLLHPTEPGREGGER